MTKHLTTTTIYVNGQDEAVVFTDTAAYSGGSAARSMIRGRRDVYVKTSEGVEIYIPFHAIMMATFEPSTATVEDPEDAFCTPVVTESEGEGDEGEGGEGEGG